MIFNFRLTHLCLQSSSLFIHSLCNERLEFRSSPLISPYLLRPLDFADALSSVRLNKPSNLFLVSEIRILCGLLSYCLFLYIRLSETKVFNSVTNSPKAIIVPFQRSYNTSVFSDFLKLLYILIAHGSIIFLDF